MAFPNFAKVFIVSTFVAVACHQAEISAPWIITNKEAHSFLTKPSRSKRSDPRCNSDEDYCERNKMSCMQHNEQSREYYCGFGHSCSSTQACYLSTPCPVHYALGCTDNQCLSFPCYNGGTCTDTPTSYFCTCVPGWDPANDCSTDYDECQSNPCQNGGSCNNNFLMFFCECVDGYEGELCEKASAINLTCDFETRSECFLQPFSTSNAYWSRNTGCTASSSTGPCITHDGNNTNHYYMYLETSSSNYETAELRANLNYAFVNTESCLSFYYHMYGANINELRVEVTTMTRNYTIWSKSGEQGDMWFSHTVTLPAMTGLKFVGVSGSSYRGDIALDDVLLTAGACEVFEDNPSICDVCAGNGFMETFVVNSLCYN